MKWGGHVRKIVTLTFSSVTSNTETVWGN